MGFLDWSVRKETYNVFWCEQPIGANEDTIVIKAHTSTLQSKYT